MQLNSQYLANCFSDFNKKYIVALANINNKLFKKTYKSCHAKLMTSLLNKNNVKHRHDNST